MLSIYVSTCLSTHNMTYLPFGNAKLCGIIISDYNRHTNTKGEFAWKIICGRGGRFQMIFYRAGLISLEECSPDAFDFLPLDHFSAESGGLPNLSIKQKSVEVWPVSAAKCTLPSSLIQSFWAFRAVMMETFLNSLFDSFS